VGGIGGARELIQIGWGEGMNLAADYLNSLPHGADQTAASSLYLCLQPLFRGETRNLTHLSQPGDPAPTLVEADHAVLYLSDAQRNRPSAWAVSLLRGQEPEHVVMLGGIEYAWIYDCANLPLYTQMPSIQHPTRIPLLDETGERKLTLLGYDLPAGPVPSGGSVEVALYWRCDASPGAYYNILLQPVNAVMRPWGGTDGSLMGGHPPTLLWVKGLILCDRRHIPILPGTPPGSYRLLVSLYDAYGQGGLRPPDGEPLFLTAIEVEANPGLIQSDLGMQHHSDSRLGESIHLMGYNVEETAKPGDTLHLTLFWEARAEISEDYTVFTHLLDEANDVRGQHDGQPADGFSATSKWRPGIPLRDPHDLPLPPDLPPGDYRIEVGMYDAETGERLPVLEKDGTIVGERILLSPIRVEAP
jgi:hypothetical protein